MNRQPFISCFFLSAAAIIFVLLGPPAAAGTGPLRVHFLDAGYGDATLIEFPDATTMLLDAGDRAFAPALMDYLRKHRITAIDTAVITHPHKNHFGGFPAVSRQIPVRRVFTNGDPHAEEGYSEILKVWEDARVPVTVLKKGDRISALPQGVQIRVLHPASFDGSPNGNSLVLWLGYEERSMAFLADIEEKEQASVFAEFPELRRADCIKLPHHGGPLSDDFGRDVRASLFIISTGPNPWGLPRPEDLKKLAGAVYRTDLDGTIVVETDGRHLAVIP